MKKEIIVLHEYGDKRHYEALAYNDDYLLIYYEFGIARQLFKYFKTLKISIIKKLFKNIMFQLQIHKLDGKTIILGMAPYDWHIMLFYQLLGNNNLVYHTSWPFWDRKHQPKMYPFVFQKIKAIWEKFLEHPRLKIVTVTNAAKESIQQTYDAVCISVIPHSINGEYYFQIKKDKNRKKNRILFVGRLIPEKGIDLILSVSKKLGDKYEFHFTGEGKLKKKIIDASKQNPQIFYHGKINDKKKLNILYNDCNYLLIPSISTNGWEETFGIVIIEAMAAGLITIASNTIGSKSIIDNYINGIIIEDMSVNMLIRIFNSIERDNRLAINLQENALKKSSFYKIKNVSKIWESVID